MSMDRIGSLFGITRQRIAEFVRSPVNAAPAALAVAFAAIVASGSV
jgi:hypothetical protein